MNWDGTVIAAVIVAAGKGLRMGGNIPKQYLKVCGQPVLVHTLRAFAKSMVDRIVLVCPEGDEEYVREHILLKPDSIIGKDILIVPGGKERFDSSYAGIMACGDADYILIHDGVRACVTTELINRVCLELIEKKASSCCPAIPVKDTVRVINDAGAPISIPDRKTLRSIQTPQGFESRCLNTAYECFMDERENHKDMDLSRITDDTMLVEHYACEKPVLIEGESTNIKITTPEDLLLAEALLRKQEL